MSLVSINSTFFLHPDTSREIHFQPACVQATTGWACNSVRSATSQQDSSPNPRWSPWPSWEKEAEGPRTLMPLHLRWHSFLSPRPITQLTGWRWEGAQGWEGSEHHCGGLAGRGPSRHQKSRGSQEAGWEDRGLSCCWTVGLLWPIWSQKTLARARASGRRTRPASRQYTRVTVCVPPSPPRQ